MALRTLTIALEQGSAQSAQLPDAVEQAYLGGRGAIAWLLSERLSDEVAPLSAENLLVFAAGPLAGTQAYASGGFVVGTRSPFTGGIGYSWAQGHWGAALRSAGHELLVLEGVAPEWCWIQIDGPKVAIRPVRRLQGLDAVTTSQALRDALGEEYSVIALGPAGENNVAYSSIVAEGRYMAEPAGTGVVMAHKRVKAIAVRRGSEIPVIDERRFHVALELIKRRSEQSDLAEHIRNYGSTTFLLRAYAVGALTGRNGQDGEPDDSLAHIRSSLALRGQQTSRGCIGCPVPCYSDYTRANRSLPRPELELVAGFGARCGITRPDALIHIADLCMRLGIDPSAASAAVAFLMECQQRDLYHNSNLPWGNEEAVFAALELLAKRQERRDVLSLGVGEMQEIFWQSEAFAPQVKWLAQPALDPRAMQELALAMASAPIGGDYRYAMAYDELVDEPPSWLPEQAEAPNETKGKVARLIWHERLAAVLDAANLCRRLSLMAYQVTPAELIALINAATGRTMNGTDLVRMAERIITLERLFLQKNGYEHATDALPERWAETALEDGKAAGQLPALAQMLADYYRRHGWDYYGNPTSERLLELGIPES